MQKMRRTSTAVPLSGKRGKGKMEGLVKKTKVTERVIKRDK